MHVDFYTKQLSVILNIIIMQTIHQHALQKSNIQKNEGLNMEQNQSLTKSFVNPICKQTYTALPRIYGKKRKVHRAKTEPPRGNKKQLNSSRAININRKSSVIQHQKSLKNHQLSQRKSPSSKHSQGCSKKKCQCNVQLQKNKISRKRTFLSSIVGHIKLPQIQKFQLEDLQSAHKVSLQNVTNGFGLKNNGLNKILQQKKKDNHQQSKSSSPIKLKQNLQKEIVDGRNILKITKMSFKYMKTKQKFKPKFNNTHRFDIEQESEEQNDQADDKLQKKSTVTFKTQSKPFYTKSSYSVVLNDSRFNSSNTRYSQLNLRQTSTQLGGRKRKVSVQKNLFKVPQQKQYIQFLKNYEKINANFDFITLVKKSAFRVIKTENQVYFGEVNSQEQRHGEGINITEKQIFQGRYERNLKVQGCQRNLDGVFAGKYEYGLRNGYGIFKWYNGQFFQGHWQNGVKHGKGKWTSPKGDFYDGQWVHNRQQGKGVFKHRTSTYKGQFVNFLKHGEGEEVFANGDYYKGQYRQGRPNGKGKYTWNDGSQYEGQFYKGMRQGKGKWFKPNMFQYEVQAPFIKTLNMGWVNKAIRTDKSLRANFNMVSKQVESYSIGLKTVNKQRKNKQINQLKKNEHNKVDWKYFLNVFYKGKLIILLLNFQRLRDYAYHINLQLSNFYKIFFNTLTQFYKEKLYYTQNIPNFIKVQKNQNQNMRQLDRRQIKEFSNIRDYQILNKLGNGLTAQVYSARSILHGNVSIKIIQPKFVSSKIGAQLIQNEIKILKSLNHQSVLKFIEKIEENNRIYIVTQLCQGGNLQSQIRKNKKLNEKQAIKLLKSVVKGCLYLRQKNIVHRDIKPSNIFLKEGKPILADFGFAVLESDRKLLNINAGSPLYMPYQSLTKKIFTQKSDVFALGVCLFQMLTGTTPWRASSEQQLIQNIARAPKIANQIRQSIKKLILKCLSFQQSCRPTFQNIMEQIIKIEQQKQKQQTNQIKNSLVNQKQKRSISIINNLSNIQSRKELVLKNQKSCTNIRFKRGSQNQGKQNRDVRLKLKSIESQKVLRSVTLNQNVKKKQVEEAKQFNQNVVLHKIQQFEEDFLSKIKPDQFKFLPLSLIHKFKFILCHYNKLLGNQHRQLQSFAIGDNDALISEVKKCKNEIQLCRTIESFVRRLFRLTKNYKQYKCCLTNLQPLYNRVTAFVV